MSVPKYAQLADEIRSKIRTGELRPGDVLPSITELKEAGWSYNTIRSAMLLLRGEGLIRGEPGVAVFVK